MKTASRFALTALLGCALAPLAWLHAQDDQTKWNVADPFGLTTTIEFDTSEGTWMNVDVSPDGGTIVFDLLGDLYTMPIEGSGVEPARKIAGGPVFDMQPRFSPDGRSIAFASDRDGLWNIWVMDADGSNPRQVSKEARWFVNSPTWSPDGEYIFARRHFVETRSLGAGEVWMYHASGSGGLQVTEKVSWQKDAGEPAISPDGRTLYYSKDVTPGQTFEYNKDPNGTIYAIIRRDLTDGREERAVSVQGGSVTPRPSPDGRYLAYVRRVRLGSQLVLRDLDTGRDQSIFDRLDKDLQEAWAIHGLYPQYAWTPDGRSIVIWGQGRIWRVAVPGSPFTRRGPEDRPTATEIPFTVHVEQTVHRALRFKQKVGADEFPVRMLRDVTTSPDGRLVAYGALGHVYVKALPDGEPRRLTTSDEFEFDPAFSPDGSQIAYVSWSDAEYGRVKMRRTDGTDGRVLVRTPGHYTEPAFSPDGRWVTYRSVRADGTRTDLHGEHRGIFVVGTDGGSEPRLVTRDGADPQFDHTGTRLYLRGTRNGKFALYSVDLTGGDEIVHLQSENAMQVVPSPDGQWIAFEERYHAYVAPFPRTGRPIEFGPTGSAYPTARISRDTGWYLHWSGDSRTVHWSLGPDLFSRDLSRTFAFFGGEGARAQAVEPDEPETAGVPIGFTAPTDRPDGTVALVGARVVTMAGRDADPRRAVIDNATIIVEGNRIAAVGPSRSVRVPAGAHRVDVRGKTIIPGLIDVHAHVGSEGDGILAQQSWPLAANLAYGVTTSHDPSNDTATVFANAELIRAGRKLGPRLLSTGMILYGAETPFKAVVASYEDALSHVRRLKAAGAFTVKSYNQQRRDARQMILKAARDLEMMVVPEGGSLLYYNQSMVIDGHTGVEHSLPVPVLYKDTATLFGRSGTGYTPTMIVGYGGLSGEYYWYERTNVWENARLLQFVPRAIVDARSRRRLKAAGDDDFNHILIGRGAKAILDAGGRVLMGAHGQLQGLGAHWETWMMVQGGMTPLEALATATRDAAWYIGLDDDLGTLEAGKLADLVVLDRNPLDDIRHTESIAMVMKNGRLYDKDLNEVGNHPRPRLPFYWER